jgi:rfaE bifunctional protein kinase chain/domain
MNLSRVSEILAALPKRKVAVVGDFCVDRTLHIDPAISDTSRETGLPIHQVVRVVPEPGGGANVVKDVAALGVGGVYPVGYLGLDGEGFELGRLFDALGVERDFLQFTEARHTPVYTKPVVVESDAPPRPLNRLDIFPREPMDEALEAQLIEHLHQAFEKADVVIVADYDEPGKHGVISMPVREALNELARNHPETPVLADSRRHIDHFRHILIKPNPVEITALLGESEPSGMNLVRLTEAGQRLAERNHRPVLITLGREGCLLCATARALKLPVFPSEQYGEVDPVGAGDQVIATVASALAGGARLDEAAILAMVAASVSVEQLGTCGTVTPEPLRRRFKEYAHRFPGVVAD